MSPEGGPPPVNPDNAGKLPELKSLPELIAEGGGLFAGLTEYRTSVRVLNEVEYKLGREKLFQYVQENPLPSVDSFLKWFKGYDPVLYGKIDGDFGKYPHIKAELQARIDGVNNATNGLSVQLALRFIEKFFESVH